MIQWKNAQYDPINPISLLRALAVLLVIFFSCVDLPEVKAMIMQTAKQECDGKDGSEARYKKALLAWRQLIEQPNIQESSRTEDYINNEPYRKIVALGEKVLSYIIQDIQDGEFLLNNAAKKITGIDVRNLYPNEQIIGEQDVSALWVMWWNDNKENYAQTCRSNLK